MKRLADQVEELREELREVSREKIGYQNKINVLEEENKALRVEVEELNKELMAYRKGWLQ